MTIPQLDDYPTFGSARRCAWSITETLTRIQTNDPAVAKELRRIPDCRQVGYSVTRRFLRLFDAPYTLSWVCKNVVANFFGNTPDFPRENQPRKPKICRSEDFPKISTNYVNAETGGLVGQKA